MVSVTGAQKKAARIALNKLLKNLPLRYRGAYAKNFKVRYDSVEGTFEFGTTLWRYGPVGAMEARIHSRYAQALLGVITFLRKRSSKTPAISVH